MKRLLITIFLSTILSTAAYAVPYVQIPDGRLMFEVPTVCSPDVAIMLHVAKQRKAGVTAEQQLAQVVTSVKADPTIDPKAVDFVQAMIGYIYARPLMTTNEEIIEVVDLVIVRCMDMQPYQIPTPEIFRA